VTTSAVALLWPWKTDPFIASRPHLGLLIQITMFCVGCLITRAEIAGVARRWPLVLGGTLIQYTTMPLLAWGLGHLAGLPPAYLVGVIVVGCVPGAMASNVLTLAARGNVSYSVSLTTSATLLSPLVVPLAFYLTLRAYVPIDPVAEAITLITQVVGPVVLGHLVCRLIRPVASPVRRAAPALANLTIIWIIAVVVALNRGRLLTVFGGDVSDAGPMLLTLLALNVLGYAAGYAGGGAMRLDGAMRRALTLEVGMQNAGLGTVLVLDLFKDDAAAAIPTALYTFGCMLTGTILAQWWSRTGG
jgi:BASS family bile acid:Na+ symporter